MNGVPNSPESIIADIRIDADNAIEFNDEMYLRRIQSLVKGHRELYVALCEAKNTIHSFHNMMDRSPDAEKMWSIYDTHSPEMKRLNAALSNSGIV